MGEEKKKDSTVKSAPAKEAAKKSEAKAPSAGRMGRAQGFARGVASELKKVHWPTRQEVITYSGVVVAAVAIVGFMIFLVDEAIGRVLRMLIG
ncbi:preprotein translocase subunit SecE [Heliorestis convoluta]|uniref:Protein translocase subunit SecE n=1 Tax=Heliorestis convoluta TaxID=356322 RepID=A0A5Q2N4G3_9FIRM|nr:preprotein translocase subunit SecE [Heliorestis convoluta]QGG49201.1 preprotein translocase subunit SecE [Heliorestis convoluta]